MKLFTPVLVTLFCFSFLPVFVSAQTPETKQSSSPKFHVGQQVEAFNSGWWKATILEIGSGNMDGYIKVRYDGYSSASDQYLKVSNIRIPAKSTRRVKNENPDKNKDNTAIDKTAAGPRKGRYIILSYGADVHNKIVLGYFDLDNGKYKYYDAGKNLLGAGTYSYNAVSQLVNWKSGLLKDYTAYSKFTVSREGKTHNLRMKGTTTASNSTDSK